MRFYADGLRWGTYRVTGESETQSFEVVPRYVRPAVGSINDRPTSKRANLGKSRVIVLEQIDVVRTAPILHDYLVITRDMDEPPDFIAPSESCLIRSPARSVVR